MCYFDIRDDNSVLTCADFPHKYGSHVIVGCYCMGFGRCESERYQGLSPTCG